MRVISALVIAFATYSRIPMPQVDWNDENRRLALCFFPLIGAVIGAVLAAWAALCRALSLGAALQGAVGALLPLAITGGIHMDGFMDTCDAMASWQPRERRLEILKDSRVGAFAVMGCAGALLLAAGLLAEATPRTALLLAPAFVLSRALSAWMMMALPSARPGGMLDGFARTAQRRAVTASSALYAVLCAAAWTALAGWMALIAAAAAGLCALWYWRLCSKYFGGVTGDLAGWFVQITELCLTAVMMIGGKML